MILLVLGGTRSGKSAEAERLAVDAGGPVTYVATAYLDPADADHAARITAHRSRRPDTWSTVECREQTDLVRALNETEGTLLVDSLGTWITLDPGMDADTVPLLGALAARTDTTIVVSDEVGLAVHAPTELGRRYVDALGSLNQQVSALADRAILVIAGRPLDLPARPAQANDSP